MVTFWDTSALIPLIMPEKTAEVLYDFRNKCQRITAWTLTPVEVCSTLSRLLRLRQISEETHLNAISTWEEIETGLEIIEDLAKVKIQAKRILRIHPLKAADALQLAAAIIATLNNPMAHAFVSLDESLRSAASKEGFQVFPAG